MPPSTSSSYDIEIYDPELNRWHGLMIVARKDDNGVVQPPTVVEGLFSAEGGSEIQKRLLPHVQEDWSRGMGIDYEWAPGLYTRSPGYVCPAGAATVMTVPTPTAGRILYHQEFGADLFFAQAGTASAGGRVLRSVGGSGALSEHLTLATGQYMRGLLTADNGSGTTLIYAFSSDGGVANGYVHYWDGIAPGWTSTAANTFGAWGRAAAAKVFWTTSDGIGAARIVCISGPRTVSFTRPNGDPMQASSWVEGVRIGGSRGQLRELAAARTHIYVSAEDGLFDLDELGNSPNLMSYVEGMVGPGNGYAVQYHDGAVFMSLGTSIDRVIVEQNGVLQEMPGMCGPGWGQRAENPVLGWSTAFCVDQGYLVAPIFSPTTRKTYVCWGKSARSMGVESRNGMLWWGPEVTTGYDVGVSAISVSSLVSHSRRLWMSLTNDAQTETRVAWVSLPVAGSPLQSIYSGGTHKFNTGQASGDVQTVASLYSLPDTYEDKPSLKILHQLAFGTRGLDATTKLVEYDRADPAPGSDAWGTGTDITVSPSQTITRTDVIKGHELSQRLDFISPNGAASTPQVAMLNSLRRTAWKVAPSFTVQIIDVQWGAGVVNLENGTDETYDPVYVADRIRAIVAFGPTTMRDRTDRRATVKLEQVMDAVVAYHDDGTKTMTARLEITRIGDAA